MNVTQIHNTFKSALQLLSTGRVINAIEKTRQLVDELQLGDYSDRLDELGHNYRFLLNYYADGVDDSQRKIIYNKLIARLFFLNCELREELMIRNSSNYEYSQKRYFPYSKRFTSPSELLSSLRYYHSQSVLLLNSEESHQTELKRLRSNYEVAVSELFTIFWLKSNYQADEKEMFSKLLESNYQGWLEKSMIVSALTLNLWRMFDESKLMMLFDACQCDDPKARQRALVGLCFVLARHNRFLPYFPAIRNRLVLLADDNRIVENFQNIIIQIIATADTDKISKKMQEEILPEMMKISPKIKGKMDHDSLMNSDEWNEENPEWQDLLEESGISDKLKELSELQMEGADVYMSTFSLLKSFPFFSVFSNWFLPFDAGYSVVKDLFPSEDKSLLTAFVANNIMCNSDKYSFCLSILQMPESQRDTLKNSFKLEAEQLDEMTREESLLTPDLADKNISKQYVQDLFRFFKLYPQHNDFSDMFSLSLLMHRSYLFDILSVNAEFKTSIAEFYFSKSRYEESVELFEEIAKVNAPSALLYQKIGYSYQQSFKYDKAFEAYQKADLIQPDDIWTVKKMAVCCRLSGNYTKALEYYQHVDFLKPEQKSVQLQTGRCYMELGKYKEALALFFKLDALEEEDSRVWREIAWCSFVLGNVNQAEYYSKKLIDNDPTAFDYLNAGHIAWCRKQLPVAINYYRQCMALQENNEELFVRSLLDDKVYLQANGVDVDEIPLMLDVLTISNS